MYIYIYAYILFLRTARNIAMYRTRPEDLDSARVEPYFTHRHFGSEHCIHQHEPEQSHRGRAKREKRRGRGGRTREKEKRRGSHGTAQDSSEHVKKDQVICKNDGSLIANHQLDIPISTKPLEPTLSSFRDFPFPPQGLYQALPVHHQIV